MITMLPYLSHGRSIPWRYDIFGKLKPQCRASGYLTGYRRNGREGGR
jgi:hypothetical protein